MFLHNALQLVYWIRDGFIRRCKAVELGVDRLGPLQPTSSEVGTNAIQPVVFLDVHFYSSSGTFELGIKGIKKSVIALPVKIKMQCMKFCVSVRLFLSMCVCTCM